MSISVRKPGGGKSLAGTAFRKATTAVRLRGRQAFFAISHYGVIGSTAHQFDTRFRIRSIRNDITGADAMTCRYAKSIELLKQSGGRFVVAVTTAKNCDRRIDAHKRHLSFHDVGAPDNLYVTAFIYRAMLRVEHFFFQSASGQRAQARIEWKAPQARQ